LPESGDFISETKVDFGATASDPHPGIGTLREERTPLKVVFAQELERLLKEGTYHQGPHRTAQIQAVKG
jgi:hypothetical protein